MVSKLAEHNINLDIICTIEHIAVKHTVTRNTSLKHTAVENAALENTRKGWCSVIYVQIDSDQDAIILASMVKDTRCPTNVPGEDHVCVRIIPLWLNLKVTRKRRDACGKKVDFFYTQERPGDAQVMINFLYSYLPLIVSMLKAPYSTM